MRRKLLPPRGAVLGTVLAVLLLGSLATAQSWRLAADPTAEVSELLRRGRDLEVERRWSEAFSHYEDAIRQFPNDASLQRRFQFTRLHYDLDRRYHDQSYCDELTRTSLGQALDLYSEILLKMQVHYVESLQWKELVERGTNNLEVAVTEPAFLERYALEGKAAALDAFRHELRRVLGPRVVQTRMDARDAVAAAASLAQSRLGLDPSAVVMEYTCGATNALDVYSSYLTPGQLNDVESQIEGNFVGLGVELRADQGSLLIVRVIPGSPAEKAGLRADDRITRVDGQSTDDVDADQAADLLQGEAGTQVRLTVVSPGLPPRQIDVSRQRVEVPSVDDARIVDTALGIGYLKLVCFQKTTCRDLDAALWKLYHEGMKSLIIDLRGNPGGLLVTAVEAADRFVGEGIIVSTRGRSVQEDFTYSARKVGTWRVPLVVMIDRDSASGAEIFAGAIRDHRRGTVVGARSYGKGSVQTIFPLAIGEAGVRLTTAKFYSPSGHPYSGVGVEPDVVVHQVARAINGSSPVPSRSGEDPMLAAALAAARQLLARR